MSAALGTAEILFAACLLGGMTFFAAGVAPTVFRALDGETAGAFLRRIFPVYYAYLAVTAALAGLAALPAPERAAAYAAIALTAVWTRQRLTPRLNAWRDAELAGDAAAGARFKTGHRLSVAINFVQLAVAATALGAASL